MKRILMVCMGNICRSPMAAIVAAQLAKSALLGKIEVDSAGTHAAALGERPDPRAKASLLARKYVVGSGRPRRVVDRDFERFDLILAMDSKNALDLRRICPEEHLEKIRLFLEFAPECGQFEVPDPYYGSAQGFDAVLDLCETGARGLVRHLQALPAVSQTL